jgi:hypothetical protein
MRTLLPLMIKEEFRFHASHSNRYIFLSFPVIVCMFSLATAVSSPRLFQEIPAERMISLTHISIFMYGMSVGTFAFLGMQIVEQRFGRRNFLVAMPSLLPMTFKKTFFGLYLRDVIFYVALLIIPLVSGLILSVPVTHFSLISIGWLGLTLLLSFLLGMSFSFFMSAVYVRSTMAFSGLVVVIVAALGGVALEFYDIWLLVPTLKIYSSIEPFFLLETLALIALLPLIATLLTPERHEAKIDTFKEEFPEYEKRFSFFKSNATLIAKEFLDLKRSKTYSKMLFSFIVPLLFLSVTSFLVRFGFNIPVGFNTIFYAAMVGFFGILIYSWLNNVDVTDYFETLPVSVPQLIRVRLIVFAILTLWISTAFVIGIAVINGDFGLIWLALLVMFIISMYMVITIAYLTGLRPNTSLFAPDVMLKFWALTLLPDVCITLLSFTLYTNLVLSVIGIFIVCFMLIVASIVLYKGIDRKWGKAEFAVL